ncbi:MAG: hypothetical protein KDA57_21230 [Planctomycetales bacterium]|nr:hypothetical protein [Planctomycetales bacterium]
MTPQADLIERLCEVLPAFRSEWSGVTEDNPFPSKSLHSVYMVFFPFAASAELSEREVEAIASIFNVEVAKGGKAENAVSTCVLEHLGKGEFSRRVWRYLGPSARAQARA